MVSSVAVNIPFSLMFRALEICPVVRLFIVFARNLLIRPLLLRPDYQGIWKRTSMASWLVKSSWQGRWFHLLPLFGLISQLILHKWQPLEPLQLPFRDMVGSLPQNPSSGTAP